MDTNIPRDMGEQPIAGIMHTHNLKPHDLVVASKEQITHKMVSRAVKGRWLTPHVQVKILHAVNSASGQKYGLRDLFNYVT